VASRVENRFASFPAYGSARAMLNVGWMAEAIHADTRLIVHRRQPLRAHGCTLSGRDGRPAHQRRIPAPHRAQATCHAFPHTGGFCL